MDMDVSIDHALLEAAALQRIGDPPAITRPFFDADAGFAAMKESNQKQIASLRASLDKYERDGQMILHSLDTAFSEHELSGQHISSLNRLVEIIEDRADKYVALYRKSQKEVSTLVKECRRLSPAHASDLKADFDVVLGLYKREIDVILIYADGVRFLRGKHDPTNKVIAKTNSPQDTVSFLEALMD
ncbi:hypothetical protein SAMN04515647_4369 [Cohaesibacter sp. ES.047]|uniref:hypothetical protein n=1 Tax=Cohaesibacter sp. ES.047 TaxID=1798205 RepID=UPI000BB7E010|nr:hypothetical protein [Cohaesibacter sp. ES.047]SNY94044.1 hypothetical protein SAMN04515647_4369 [Cohaesibacter sp. ES.047]